jgi:hypothetical protein
VSEVGDPRQRRKKIEPESDIQKTRNKPASRNQEKRKEIKTRKLKKKLFLVQCEGSKSLPSLRSKVLPDVCVSSAKGSQKEEESNKA